jgi:alpha-D-ribose 1-methylphosphonate 5-triphosphate synthase subunit PhnH
MNTLLSPAFDEPVAGSQSCFRAVLAAMSRPGTVHSVSGVDAPHKLNSAAAAVILTLVDQETPVWLDPALLDAQAWISFHTGAATTSLERADFAIATSLPALDALQCGTNEMPEAGATIVLQVPAIGSGSRFRLSGPGLREPTLFQTHGLPADFFLQWQNNRSRFPLGVDLILCAGDRIAALPRSVAVQEI